MHRTALLCLAAAGAGEASSSAWFAAGVTGDGLGVDVAGGIVTTAKKEITLWVREADNALTYTATGVARIRGPRAAEIIAIATTPAHDGNVYSITSDNTLWVHETSAPTGWAQEAGSRLLTASVSAPTHVAAGLHAVWVVHADHTVTRFAINARTGLLEGGSVTSPPPSTTAAGGGAIDARAFFKFDAAEYTAVATSADRTAAVHFEAVGGVLHRRGIEFSDTLSLRDSVLAVRESNGRQFVMAASGVPEPGVRLYEVVHSPGVDGRPARTARGEIRASRRVYFSAQNARVKDIAWGGADVESIWVHDPARTAAAEGGVVSVVRTSLNPAGWWRPEYTLPKLIQPSVVAVPGGVVGGADVAVAGDRLAIRTSGRSRYARVGGGVFVYAPVPDPEEEAKKKKFNPTLAYSIVGGFLAALILLGAVLCLRRRERADEIRREVLEAIARERKAEAARAPLPPCAFGEDVDDAPDRMVCPLAMHVMADPVTCVDGHHHFERAYLLRALSIRPECPLSREAMSEADIKPNPELAAEILSWVVEQSRTRPEADISVPKELAAAAAAAVSAASSSTPGAPDAAREPEQDVETPALAARGPSPTQEVAAVTGSTETV